MDIKKIVLVGPVYPFKGGISHYTGLLYRALSKKYDTTMVSYKMQYPKLLFKKEQRDYSNDRFKIEDTKYWLHTANPFNIAATAHKINKIKPDMVVIQWWHPYFAPCYFILSRLLRHTKIVFVCHNVFPHERFPMDRFLTKLTLQGGDGYVLHSHSDAKELLTIRKNAKYQVSVHPTYNAFKIADMSKEEARAKLGYAEDEKLLLFFGFVRAYKGLKYLLEAMPEVLKNADKVRLLVVGEFDKDRDEYMQQIQKLGISHAVQCYEGYIPDAEVEPFFAACDVVVLPYVSATQSGIAQIAYGFEKPVIATNVGGLPEVVLDGKTGYIANACDSSDLAAKICQYLAEDKAEEFVANVRQEAYKYSWNVLVEALETLQK